MKRWLRRAAFLALFILIAAGALFFLIRTEWLANVVREKIIDTATRASGARVEIGRFSFNPGTLQARVDRLLLHGTENASETPLFEVDSLEIRLKLVSLWRRDLDVQEIVLSQPRFHLSVDKDGHTNIPKPPAAGTSNAIETLLKIAAGRVEIRKGEIAINDRRVPLSLIAQAFNATLSYEKAAPRYRTSISAGQLELNGEKDLTLLADLLLEPKRIGIEHLELRRNHAVITARGTLEDLASPSVELDYEAALPASEIPSRPFAAGQFASSGHITWNKAGYHVSGKGNGSGIDVVAQGVRVSGAKTASSFDLTPERIVLKSITWTALDGTFHGAGTLTGFRHFQIEGETEDFSVSRIQAALGGAAAPWNGTLSGPVSAEGDITGSGFHNLIVTATTTVRPVEGQYPIAGEIPWTWHQNGPGLALGASEFRTPRSSVKINGTPGERLAVNFATTDFADVLPVVSLLSGKPAPEVPVQLKDGEARFDGVVSGAQSSPQIQGKLSFHGAVYAGLALSGEANVSASASALDLKDLSLHQNGSAIAGSLRLGWADWKVQTDSQITSRLAFHDVDIATLERIAGAEQILTGRLTGNVALSGILSDPDADIQATLVRSVILGEQFERAKVDFHYQRGPEGFRGALNVDEASLAFSGKYDHAPGVWNTGTLRLQAKADRINLAELESVQRFRAGMGGLMNLQGRATVGMEQGHVRVHALDGTAAVAGISVGKEHLGSLEASAHTQDSTLTVAAKCDLGGTLLKSDIEVKLSGDYPAQGKLEIPRLTFGKLRTLINAALARESDAWPLRGYLEGEASFHGSMLDPAKGRATLTLAQFRVQPLETQALQGNVTQQDLTVRNAGPVVIEMDSQAVRVKEAKFTAKETNIELSGGYSFVQKIPMDLKLVGNIDLAVISTFKPELQASGASTVNITVTGSMEKPQISGRMEVKNASLLYQDFPNTLEETSGVVQFDQNRVNVQKLTGRTGGGTFSITGFMTMGRGDTIYRLQGALNSVRVRYPEGVSTLLNADLTLTGSSTRSLLAGTVNVERSGFNPRADLASAFATTRPNTSVTSSNEFLQGLQFDVRVRTASNAQFVSEFTQELQTEADLRLRGSFAKPIVLGSIKASQGEVTFFGNRYTISRGEILFYNTAVVQPTLDLDLETRVRGITVYLTVSGPANKLNISYRSDPPLQSQEIVALLTVGRTPTGTGLTGSGDIRRANVLEQSPDSLLGGALSASVSSRLNRLFGVSRVRIDPQMTGVENIPQARLTVEQQLSRDVTLTFITNLSRTSQQIVQIQWDLSRQWSMIAQRDESGLFSVDFLLRKRFK
jgi:translocation and assembly module TamB